MNQQLPLSPASPVVFGRTFGWHHPGSTRHGVLLCAPTGFEASCIRQSWNALGDVLAQRGLHVLRFDYPGEGDALDREQGETLVDGAVAAIAEAAQWFRAHAGLETLSVVAMRLGASFAIEALGRHDIDRLALLAPVFQGRGYLREQKLTQRVMAELRPGLDALPGEINICGFVTGANDVEAIGRISMPDRVPGRQLLLVLEGDREKPEALADATLLPFDGYGALMQPATASQTPFATFSAVADWLSEGRTAIDQAARTGPREATLQGGHFRETMLRFGEQNQLVGVLCEPTGHRQGHCVHLLNAGGNSHIGWARMGVEHARALASEGIASFRHDFSGIGDSVWFPDGPRPYIYCARHIDDALTAIDEMSRRGHESHVLAGLCAGGFVAYQAGAQRDSVAGVVVANALRLYWRPEDSLDSLEQGMLQSDAVYREKLLSPAAWKRLFSGEVRMTRLVDVIWSYTRRLMARLTGYNRQGPENEDTRRIKKKLRDMSQRGASVAFVMAERDQSVNEVNRHFGPGQQFARQQPGTTFHFIAGADHELTPSAARQIYLDVIRNLASPQEKREQTK